MSEAENPRKSAEILSRKGCLRGCGLIFLGILLVYLLNAVPAYIAVTINHNKWLAANITNYSVTVNYGTFYGVFNSGIEVVKDGKIVSSNAGFSEPAINRKFITAYSCAVVPYIIFECHVEFDPEYGFPTKIREGDLDIGDTVEIVNLEPDTPPST
jgi:hypothetical protein